MARNRTRAKRTQTKNRKLALSGLTRNQVASIGDDGKIQVMSTDLRGKDNYGVVSNLGRVLRDSLLHKEPFLPTYQREYLQRNCLPLYEDRAQGVLIY